MWPLGWIETMTVGAVSSTSPERAAVRMVNASALPAIEGRLKSLKEAWHGVDRHCFVMATRELSKLRQQVIEMSAPAGWVLTLPQPAHTGGVQHALDATTQT